MRMSLLLVLLALCALPLFMIGASADNTGGVNNYYLDDGDYLLFEIDFTVGSSVLVDLEVTSNRTINVITMPQESLGPLMTTGGRYAVEPYWFDVTTLDVEFTMTEEDYKHRTYYIFIETRPYERIKVSVTYSALVDYDGDGLYGDQDDDPLMDVNWTSEMVERMEGLEDNGTTTAAWITSIHEIIHYIEADLNKFQTSVERDLGDLEDVVQANLLHLMGLIDNVLNAHQGLEEDMVSDLETITTALVAILNDLSILEEEVDVLATDVDGDIALLRGRVTDLEGRIEGLELDITDLQTQQDLYTELRADLDVLDARQATENDAREQEAEENLEAAMAEAEAVRNLGVVVGAIGVALALVALLVVWRTRERNITG